MNNPKKRLGALLAIGILAMPVLAFAQVDNEGAEGSCNDEMSEGMTCGGSSYSNPGYSYGYTAPQNSYYGMQSQNQSQSYYNPVSYQNYGYPMSSSYGYNSYPSYTYMPSSYPSYGYAPSYGYNQMPANYGYQSQSPSYSSGGFPQSQGYVPCSVNVGGVCGQDAYIGLGSILYNGFRF